MTPAMIRSLGFFALLALAAPAFAQPAPALDAAEARARLADAMRASGIVRHADLVYRTIDGVDPARFSLDVYTRPDLKRAPVVLFVHGGSWQRGDKMAVASKPLAFAPAGFVTVSTNYRFRPATPLFDMAGDIAAAAAWVKSNITAYGGDPDRIILMGHSAGGHLAALVGTNPDYLKSAGVPFSSIVGVVPLDAGPYNIARQLTHLPANSYGDMLRLVFTQDPDLWPAVSPFHHVREGLPPFLVVSNPTRVDAQTEAKPFVAELRAKGVEVEWYTSAGLDHSGVNTDIGRGDTPLTRKVVDFLRDVGRPGL